MKLNTGNTVINLKPVDNPDKKVAEFISCVMSAAVILHKHHLYVKGPGSYAAHKALNELYDALPGYADDLAEKWQGYNGAVLPLVPSMSEAMFLNMTPVQFVKWLLGYVEEYRVVFKSNSMLQNIVDELVGEISSTLYKLTFLA